MCVVGGRRCDAVAVRCGRGAGICRLLGGVRRRRRRRGRRNERRTDHSQSSSGLTLCYIMILRCRTRNTRRLGDYGMTASAWHVKHWSSSLRGRRCLLVLTGRRRLWEPARTSRYCANRIRGRNIFFIYIVWLNRHYRRLLLLLWCSHMFVIRGRAVQFTINSGIVAAVVTARVVVV